MKVWRILETPKLLVVVLLIERQRVVQGRRVRRQGVVVVLRQPMVLEHRLTLCDERGGEPPQLHIECSDEALCSWHNE